MQQVAAFVLARRPFWLLAWPEALRDWAAAERSRFALWLPVCMGAGVIAYYNERVEPAWWLGGVVLALAATAAALARGRPILRGACCAVAAAGLGCMSAQVATWRAPPLLDVPKHAVVVEGLVRAVEILPAGERVTLEQPRLDGGPNASRMVRVRLHKGDKLLPETGDVLRVRAMLSRPEPPAFPGAWDLQRDAYYKDIGAYGFALGPAEVLAHAAPRGPTRWVQSLRENIAGRIAAALPPEEGSIAATLLAGETTEISAADRAAFRDSGLAHLLAVAGLHIGIVMGLTFGLTRLLLAVWERAALNLPTKAIAAFASLAAGGSYMMLTGAHVPIIRSFSMAALFTLGVLAGRRSVSLRGLALAAVAIMLIAPDEVMGVSFQMSFAAVLALVAGYAALRGGLRRLRGSGSGLRTALHHLATLALTSVLAGVASAPFGAYHFGHVQLYFVVANMVAVPLTATWVMPLGLASIALMPLHLEALALVPMGWGIDAILWVGRTVSSWPDATVAVPFLPSWGLVAISIGLAWLGLWRTRLRLAGLVLILAGLCSPAFDHPPDLLVSADGRLIGLRTETGLLLQSRSGASNFTREAWEQRWKLASATPLPAGGLAAEGAVNCIATACTLRPHPTAVAAQLLRGPPGPDACAAPVLISAEPIRLRCAGTGQRIDRFDVWRNGAYAVWLNPGGAVLVSDRETRGARPWVPSIPTSSRGAGLKPAETEVLPDE